MVGSLVLEMPARRQEVAAETKKAEQEVKGGVPRELMEIGCLREPSLCAN